MNYSLHFKVLVFLTFSFFKGFSQTPNIISSPVYGEIHAPFLINQDTWTNKNKWGCSKWTNISNANGNSAHCNGCSTAVGTGNETETIDCNLGSNTDNGKPVLAIADGVIVNHEIACSLGGKVKNLAGHTPHTSCSINGHERIGSWVGDAEGQILIKHTNLDGTIWFSGYMHMVDKIFDVDDIKSDATIYVNKGDIIGKIGKKSTTNPNISHHLHFGIYNIDATGTLHSVDLATKEIVGQDGSLKDNVYQVNINNSTGKINCKLNSDAISSFGFDANSAYDIDNFKIGNIVVDNINIDIIGNGEEFDIEFKVPTNVHLNQTPYDISFSIIDGDGKRLKVYDEDKINFFDEINTRNQHLYHDVDYVCSILNDVFNEYIYRGLEHGFFKPNPLFRPKDNLTRREALIIFYRLLEKMRKIASPSSLSNNTFNDVPKITNSQHSDYPFYIAIQTFKDLGYISGDNNNDFHPYWNISRAEFTKILAEILGLTGTNTYSNLFSDVSSSNPFYIYIYNIRDAGIIDGFQDNTFRPQDLITREQVSKFIINGFSYISSIGKVKKSSNINRIDNVGKDYEILNIISNSNLLSTFSQSNIFLEKGESVTVSHNTTLANNQHYYYWNISGNSNQDLSIHSNSDYSQITFTAPNNMQSSVFRVVTIAGNGQGRTLKSEFIIQVGPKIVDNCSKFATFEPNETFSTADQDAFPKLDQYYSTHRAIHGILPQGDVDIYKVEIDHTGIFTLDLINLPKNYDLELYDNSYNLVQSSTLTGKSDEQIVFTKTTNTNEYFYIKVFSAGSNDYNCDKTYRLEWDWTPTANGGTCDPPTGLKAYARSWSRHYIHWNSTSYWVNTNDCLVEYECFSGCSYLGKVSTYGSSGVSTSARPTDKTYRVRVRLPHCGIWSDWYYFKTNSYSDAHFPTNVIATDGTDTSTTITWNSSLYATHYRVLRSDKDEPNSAIPITGWLPNTSTSYIDNDPTLNPNIEYWYFVEAAKSSSGSGLSLIGYGDSGYKLQTPSYPSVNHTSGYFDKVVINITPVIGAGAYRIYRSTTNNPSTATPISNWITELIFEDTNIESGVTYTYWIRTADDVTGTNQSSLINGFDQTTADRSITDGSSIINLATISKSNLMIDVVNPNDNSKILSYKTSQDGLIVVSDYFNNFNTQTDNQRTVSPIGFVVYAPDLSSPIDLVFWISDSSIQKMIDEDATITSVNDIEVLKFSGDTTTENYILSDNTNGTITYLTPTITSVTGGYKFEVTGLSSLSEFWLVGPHNPSIPLPVELNTFEVSVLNEYLKHSLVEWETSTEINSSHFEIEYSFNGINFYLVGNLQTQGNSTERASYDFHHTDARIGINYYRLKIVDKDGTFEYSPIRSVEFKSIDQFEVQVFPNPTNNILNIQTPKNEITELILNDILGNRVPFTNSRKLSDAHWALDTRELPIGTYIVTIVSNDEHVIKRFVVTR